MKPLFVVSLMAFSMLSFFGQAQADTTSVQKTLMQMERDYGQAIAKNDTATVDKFLADDWVGIDFEGNSITKAELMAEMKSGASTTQSYESQGTREHRGRHRK
jgi:hypothetical protein